MVSNSAQKEEGLSGESVSETEKKKQCCSDCKVTRTPCWRNGPSGPKTLCNACGLKYAKKKRTRGKKEVMVPLEKGVLNRGLLLLPGVVKKKQRSPRRHWSEVERAALLLMSLSSSSSFSGARFSERIFYPGSFMSHLT